MRKRERERVRERVRQRQRQKESERGKEKRDIQNIESKRKGNLGDKTKKLSLLV